MRRFVTGAVLLAIVAAAAVMLSACGSTEASEDEGTKTVAMAIDADPAALGFDPATVSGGGVTTFWQGLYSSLITTDSSGAAKPGLATAFEFNADKTELTLTLRKGVKFTDGSTLSAQLVKENLDRRSDLKLGAYGVFAKGGAAEITNVATPDPATVVITFREPQASAPLLLADDAGRIVGAKAIANPKMLMTEPDGSGPYELDQGKTVHSSSYVLNENPQAWDASSYPMSTITFKVIAEPAARANALTSGQVQVSQLDPSATQVGSANRTAQFSGTIFGFVLFDKEGSISAPFGNVEVRQALSIAINRKQLAELHEGATATASFFPPGTPGHDDSLDERYEYDPAKAKQLLSEAGYPNGFSFTLVTVGLGRNVDLEAVQNDWKAIGVEMKIQNAASFAAALRAQSTTPLGYGNFTIGSDPLGFVESFLLGGTLNSQHAKDPKIESALHVAESGEGNADVPALEQLNAAIVDEGWFIPTYAQDAYVGYNPSKVSEPKSSGTSIYPLLSSIRPAE